MRTTALVPVNVVLFANGVFVDVIKLKEDKTRLEWILNAMVGPLSEEGSHSAGRQKNSPV